jgi:hypothetical protein
MATRRYYSSTAVDSTISSGINSSATSVILSNSPVGYPNSYPFVVALDYNTASEELVLVTSVSGTTLNITRGYSGTASTGHNAGAVVRHVIIAQDLTDFQDHAAAGPAGVHGITGAIATFIGTPTSANLAAAVSDETGSGPIVFATGPTLSGPVISTIVNTGTLTLPTSTDTLVGRATTDTLTNKTLTSPVINTPKTAIGINAQSGTSYTLVGIDQDKMVTLTNSGAITLTVPAGIFSTGQYINIQALGAGQVTVQGDGTSTVTGTGTKLRVQYSAATILCTASNTFQLIGDLA